MMHVRERASTVERSIDVCHTQAHRSALQRHHAVRVVHLIVDCAMPEMHGLTPVFRTVALLYSLRSFVGGLFAVESSHMHEAPGAFLSFNMCLVVAEALLGWFRVSIRIPSVGASVLSCVFVVKPTTLQSSQDCEKLPRQAFYRVDSALSVVFFLIRHTIETKTQTQLFIREIPCSHKRRVAR